MTGLTTNPVAGEVERNGQFWVKNLPLNPGTNSFIILAVDAALNTNQIAMSVVQSSVQLSVTPVSQGDLTNSQVTVSGSISDATNYAVWVNGVQATVSTNGTWSATNVPVLAGGMATFQATAIPLTSNGGAGTGGGDGVNPTDPNALDNSSSTEPPPTITFTNFYQEFGYDDSQKTRVGNSCGVLPPYQRTNSFVTNTAFYVDPDPNPIFADVAKSIGYTQVFSDSGAYCYWTGEIDYSNQMYSTIQLSTKGEGLSGQKDIYKLTISASAYSPDNTDILGPVYDSPTNSPISDISVVGAPPLIPSPDDTNSGVTYVVAAANDAITLQLQVSSQAYSVNIVGAKVPLQILQFLPTATNDVTGQTTSAIVGQQISLQCQASDTNVVLGNFQWTVPGITISNFVTNADASVGMAITNFPTNNADVTYYWVGDGSPQVSCLSVYNGQQTSPVQATFSVLRPSAVFNATTGSLALDTNQHISGNCLSNKFGLHYGVPSDCGGVPGIVFSAGMTVPDGFTGDGIAVQVINSTILRYQSTNGTWSGERATNVLDVRFSFSGEDSPGVNIEPPYCGSRTLQLTNYFTTWLMFRPTSGPSGTVVGQWVPLTSVDWNVGGEAYLAVTNCDYTNGWMGWVGTNFMNNPNPTGSNTLRYPWWTNNITNFNLEPE